MAAVFTRHGFEVHQNVSGYIGGNIVATCGQPHTRGIHALQLEVNASLLMTTSREEFIAQVSRGGIPRGGSEHRPGAGVPARGGGVPVHRPGRRAQLASVSRLLLIRHGETVGNAARIVQRPDSPLSPRGCASSSGWPGAWPAKASCGSSPATWPGPRPLPSTSAGPPTRRSPSSRCCRSGTSAICAAPYAELRLDPFAPDYAPPNGETWPAFARVDRAWARVQELAAATRGTLAVVTHGLVCRSLVGHLP